MVLLDGKNVKEKVLEEIKNKIEQNNAKIKLAIIYVGQNEASEIYIKNKIKACEYVGIEPELFHLENSTTESELISLIQKLNKDDDVYGVILQSPIPNHLDFSKICNNIEASKDIDGFTKDNIYANYANKKGILPCTVKGIIKLLNYYNIPIKGKNITIVGRGNIVGKPLSIALENLDGTVTLAHSKTQNLANICKNADVLISATGVSSLIKENFVSDGAVVIDVGISRVNGKVHGDVDFVNVANKCSYITPVPGGVGPMTVAMIIENVYESYERKNKNG